MSCKCIWMAFFLIIYLMRVATSIAVFNPLRAIGHCCPQVEPVFEAVGRSSIFRYSVDSFYLCVCVFSIFWSVIENLLLSVP